jgi:hypothetical protein
MNNTYFLAADVAASGTGGGGYWPGLVVPAAVMLVALVSAAVVLYVTYLRPGNDSDRGDAR